MDQLETSSSQANTNEIKVPFLIKITDLLLLIGILLLLLSVVLYIFKSNKIAPGINQHRVNDQSRLNFVNAVLVGMRLYEDSYNQMILIPNVDIETEICNNRSPDCAGLADLSMLKNPAYPSNWVKGYSGEIWIDQKCPIGCAEHGTGYSIIKLKEGVYKISAPLAEEQSIEQIYKSKFIQ